jgi:hypothetical protein
VFVIHIDLQFAFCHPLHVFAEDSRTPAQTFHCVSLACPPSGQAKAVRVSQYHSGPGSHDKTIHNAILLF